MPMATDLAVNFGHAREWLLKAFKRNSFGVGWGHSPEEEEPSEWGGTLDGIRALLAIGEPPLSPIISDSVSWLKGRQRADGGFAAPPRSWPTHYRRVPPRYLRIAMVFVQLLPQILRGCTTIGQGRRGEGQG